MEEHGADSDVRNGRPAPSSTERQVVVWAVFFIGLVIYLPLAFAAVAMEAEHRPAGIILLGALNAMIASLGLLFGLASGGARTLRYGSFGQRTWTGLYALLLLLCIYDSLAHALQAPFMPTLDELLPNGLAGEVRGGIYWVGLAVVMFLCFGIWRQYRHQRLTTSPPSAQ